MVQSILQIGDEDVQTVVVAQPLEPIYSKLCFHPCVQFAHVVAQRIPESQHLALLRVAGFDVLAPSAPRPEAGLAFWLPSFGPQQSQQNPRLLGDQIAAGCYVKIDGQHIPIGIVIDAQLLDGNVDFNDLRFGRWHEP